MALTSEQVHWMHGAFLIVVSGLLLLRELAVIRGAWPKYIIPLALFAVAAELFLDPFIHGRAVPASGSTETVQHFILAALLAMAGIVEWCRARNKLDGVAWKFVLPCVLITAGVLFFLHAQHNVQVSPVLLLTQHRILGAMLVLAGITRAISVSHSQHAPAFRVSWILLLLVVGVQLLLYTEGRLLIMPGALSAPSHSSH